MKKNKELATAIPLILLMLLAGTIFYHYAESWSWVDSFYFTGISMLTIGYGDLAPTQPYTKIMTVVFAFFSIGLVLFALTTIARDRRNLTYDIKNLVVKELQNLNHSSTRKKSGKKKKIKWLLFN